MQVYQDNLAHFRKQFGTLSKILNEEMACTCRDSIIQRVYRELPDTTDFEDLPNVQLSMSEPQMGDGRITRKRSVKAV